MYDMCMYMCMYPPPFSGRVSYIVRPRFTLLYFTLGRVSSQGEYLFNRRWDPGNTQPESYFSH